MNSANDGYASLCNREKGLAHPPHSLRTILRRHRSEFFEVITGAKVWTFATQNYGANIAANLIYIGKQRSNLTVHCAIYRIDWRTPRSVRR